VPSLPELQAAFTRSVFDATDAVLAAAILPDGLAAAQRIAVYRANVLGNYTSALREVYPVTLRLVGDDFFDALARRYARQVPSGSGDLHEFGGAMGTFLESFAPARELPYLPDVARLEWAVHRVFHAPHAQPLDRAALAGVPPEHLPRVRFTLHPAARLIQADYPVLDIWRVNQPGWTGPQSIDLQRGAQRLIVIRRALEVELEPLGRAEHAMLAALAADLDLQGALAAALDIDPDFDLTVFLTRHVLGGTLCGARLAE
jgi:hypothetical protein